MSRVHNDEVVRVSGVSRCHSGRVRAVSRPVLTGLLLAAGLAVSGCAGTPAVERVAAPSPSPYAAPSPARAAAAPGPSRLPVPAAVPFRRTGRDAFTWSVQPVTAAQLGASHRAGCPVAVADLRRVELVHWGFDGRTRQGELVVHRTVVADVVQVFRRLHAARFPVQQLASAASYGGDDDRLMAANATSAYNCRRVAGSSSWSEHAYGKAIDLDPVQNPYVRGSSVEPSAGRAYLDRSDVRPGMVVRGDAVVRAFAEVGWEWGGDFRSLKDYQHFSQSGR